jgi:two-component system, sensor histidine kinase PdtaS
VNETTEVPVLDLTLSLALAVVAASKAPMLLLDEDLRVVAASNSFRRAFDIDLSNLREPTIFSLGRGEWDKPRLRSFLEATLCGDAEIEHYEFELERPGQPTRCLVLHADKLVYGDLAPPRGLLAITDVTDARDDARRKDELARHNAVLLKEVRHRVANSLQIIASVLLQSARNTQSEEARGQLRNAHLRLMSVASLERHLTTVTVGEVDLSAYLNKLCASIAASMIHQPAFRLNVSAEGVTVDPDTSVSIGLMVTELVMNALKHAFNDRESGEINVSLSRAGDGWTLTVSDDGVGIAPEPTKLGLGTSIVEALARQLHATVRIMRGDPGTTIMIQKPSTDA